MPRYRLGPHGVVEDWTEEQVRAAGYDPWMSQIFEGVQNAGQFGSERFDWSGYGLGTDPQVALDYNPGYIPTLLDWRAKDKAGTLTPLERMQYEQWVSAARAIPMRDPNSLTYDAGQSGFASAYLTGQSPDIGNLMLTLADKMDRGQATPQERQLYQTAEAALRDQNWRASVPQPSDAFSPLGDNLMGALGIIGLGAGASAAIAPLYAGAGLGFGSAAGLAGTAGSLTNMMGQALDNEALSKAGGMLSLLGGLSSVGGILNKGISSIGDVLSLGKGLYGTAQKGLGLASSFGGSDSKDADSRTQRSRSAGGGGVDTNQLGGILTSIVGGVGTALSMADAGRYMEQLKDVYGKEENIRKMIDEAYALAAARYDVFYAQSQEQYKQAQEAYQKAQERYETYYQDARRQQQQQQEAYAKAQGRDETAYQQAQLEQQQRQEAYARGKERYETYYGQTQQEQQQRQAAYGKGQGQKDEDRAREIQTWQEERAKVDQNFQARAAQAQQERDLQLSTFGTNREQTLANYNKRMAEAQEDRGREIGVFNENWSRHLGSYDRAVAEAQQERGMDLAGYQARHAIGANLRDPAAIKAGAEALYQPLSELARGRIAQNAQAEMASRGVTGGGMYANRLSAEAFAPHEQALWNNAMQAYLSGQTGAINAYGDMDLARSPEYREMNVPRMTNSPQWNNIQLPNFSDLPTYNAQHVPRFLQTSASDVPGTVGYVAGPGVPDTVGYADGPGVPGAVGYQGPPGVPGAVGYQGPPGVPGAWNPGAPTIDRNVPKPYAPGGAGGGGGLGGLLSGAGGAGGVAGLVNNITKLFGLGTGPGQRTWEQLTNYEQTQIQNELNAAMQNNDLFGFGTGGANPDFYSEPTGPGMGWDAGGYGMDMYAGGSAFFNEGGPTFDYSGLGDIDYSIF